MNPHFVLENPGPAPGNPQTFDLSEEGGLISWVRTSKQPLLVRDFQRELDDLPARPRYISNAPPRSAIFIPLVSGHDTIGIAGLPKAPNPTAFLKMICAA
ncbi:MAG: hypothetical protein R3D55_23990 [Chloroflexota bacterium]